MAEGEDSDFATTVAEEMEQYGLDCASVEMLLDMASVGEVETVAMVLCDLVDQGNAGWAADITKRSMNLVDGCDPSKPDATLPDYGVGASLLGRMIDAGRTDCAVEVTKFLVLPKTAPDGSPYYDIYDAAFTVGSMAGHSRLDWAAQVCSGLYQDGSAEGAYASIVPFMLGTLLDQKKLDWVSGIAQQLICASGAAREADYSTVGWLMAQMVWRGRPDWPASICEDLMAQRLRWFNVRLLLDSVAAWADPSYAHAVASLMRKPGQGAPPPLPLPQQQQPVPSSSGTARGNHGATNTNASDIRQAGGFNPNAAPFTLEVLTTPQQAMGHTEADLSRGTGQAAREGDAAVEALRALSLNSPSAPDAATSATL